MSCILINYLEKVCVGANFAWSYLGERLWLGGKWAHFRKEISRSTCICNIIPSYENYASLTALWKISRTGHCLADGTFTYCWTLDHYHLEPQSNLHWQMIALNGYLLLTRINEHEYTQAKQGSLTNRLADGTLFVDRLILHYLCGTIVVGII